MNEAARLALAVAEDARRLWEEDAALDKLSANSDIARPETPSSDAPSLQLATPFSVLLRGYFVGGRSNAVDPKLARDIRAAVAETGHQAGLVAE